MVNHRAKQGESEAFQPAARIVRLTLLLAASIYAQVPQPGPQSLTFLSSIDDTDQPYALYLPYNFDPSRRYPLIISLHEENENHRLNLRRVFGLSNRLRETDARAANGPFPRFPQAEFIVASPLARGSIGFQGIPEADVYEVLDDVKKRFPVDEDRIYLTGASVGGGGTLWLGLTRPDVWAAIAPLCPIAPSGASELAGNALNLPVHLFQGAQDPMVLPAEAIAWRNRLRDAGAPVEYTEILRARHNLWDYAYRGSALFNWLGRHRRNRFPERVQFATRYYKYRSAYWVEITGLTPGSLASIDARFAAVNQIQIQTTGLDGFTLRLEGCPRCDEARPLSVTIDGTQIMVRIRDSLGFTKVEGQWKAGQHARLFGGKGPGREGPISAAVSRRHLYVYGTADSPDELELARRREQAEFAANWRKPPFGLMLTLRAVADTEVTEDDLRSSDLVLFGTRTTNRLIARLASNLPLELNPGAADFGLLYIAPVGGRYALISSGLPWWNQSSSTTRQAGKPEMLPFEMLSGLEDFILFRRSIHDVVAEGRFDRNWRLTAEQAAKIAAAGVVQVK
jgi:pimeloyl-ACP methyl ester carboxylesterase